MEKRFQLFISLDKPYFTHTDLISGTLHLIILEPLCLEKINLKIKKNYEAQLKIIRNNQRQKLAEKREIYNNHFELYSSASSYTKISSGHHTFPFQFYLKNGDNASTSLMQVFSSCLCKISSSYVIDANIKLYGIYMPLIHTTREIPIVDGYVSTGNCVIQIELSSCFCVINTSFDLMCRLDKEMYFTGDTAKITIDVGSKRKIYSFDVYLYQIMSLYVQDNFRTMSKFVAKGGSEKIRASGCVDCELMLPGELASTVSEEKFDVKYILQVIVTFERSSPVRFKKDIFLIKKIKPDTNMHQIDALKGIDAATQFFTLK
ncbi:hypothetical protein COBT_002859 [Conglomerata obtusa]